jgi:ketosteroid isomerase-like protein
MAPEEELRQTVAHIQAISQRYINGEAAPFLACWSHADDVTIFGAWGAYERGWAQVGPRLEWGARRYRGGHTDFELLALSASADLGYTVWLERGETLVEGETAARPTALRVTQMYRREADGWKIIHRHGDAIIAKTAPAAVLQD